MHLSLRLSIVILSCFAFSFANGQVTIPSYFQTKLETLSMTMDTTKLINYKVLPRIDNDYLQYDFAMYSQKDKLEIRCYLIPFDTLRMDSQFPHVKTGQLFTTLIDNTQQTHASAFDFGPITLRETFRADWGHLYFFHPKEGFSASQHCKMLTLYKEGVGTAFVFFLFDKANNQAVDEMEDLFLFK